MSEDGERELNLDLNRQDQLQEGRTEADRGLEEKVEQLLQQRKEEEEKAGWYDTVMENDNALFIFSVLLVLTVWGIIKLSGG